MSAGSKGFSQRRRPSGSASALELPGAAPSAPSPRRRPEALSGHPWGEGDADATELQGLGGPGSVEISNGRKPNTKRRQTIPLELRAKTSFENPWTGRYVFAASAMVSLCAVFAVALPATAAGDYLASDFFPLSGNATGTYHMWGNMDEGEFFDFMLTTKVLPQQVSIRGYDAWEVELWRDGQKDDSQFYTENATGIGWIQKPHREYASPHMYLPASLVLAETTTDTVDVWQTWEGGTYLSGNSWRSVTPIGMETVAVEAGTFSALRVDWQEISTMYWTTDGGIEMKEVCDGGGSMWFVQGQGLLKRTGVGSEANYWLDGGDWVQGQTDYQDHTMELVPEPTSLALLALGGLALIRRHMA